MADEQGRPVPEQPRYVAHTPNDAGQWHALEEHTRGVAALARGFAERFGGGELAYWAGLLHDLGKFAPEFQEYLLACYRSAQRKETPPVPGSVPHKQAGAAVGGSQVTAILAQIILGHHGQVPNKGALAELRESLPRLPPLLHCAATEIQELSTLPKLDGAVRTLCKDAHEMELLARMVYSCLVDADSLDTEAHFQQWRADRRTRRLPSLAELRDRLVSDQERLTAEAARGGSHTGLLALRTELYTACREAALRETGVFRLTSPTGVGKTRSSLAFALEHAARHGLERVIYALPYTSIVDQTAQEFQTIFGAESVLEHHSAREPKEGDALELWCRLAAENWDAPLIVTTTVQLLESLFGNRPARSRKVHRLARSVIVLDEVQALPVGLLEPIVQGLRGLCARFGTTVLLCTATQPALDVNSLPPDLAPRLGFDGLREIAPDPPRVFAALRRVRYDLSPLAESGGWDWPQAAEEMRRYSSCLAIVNTRKAALKLLQALEDDDALHLSTLLCGRHRRDVLAKIRLRLKEGRPCRVVSTQVVEAGVDLDFPCVLRALGPLDRIVQAAGRCNREGKLPSDESPVIVFQPADAPLPRGSYEVATKAAQRFLRDEPDLHDPELYEQYFRWVYAHDTVDTHEIQRLRKDLDFPAIAEKFRLIDEDTVPVLVRYEPCVQEIDGIIARFRSAGAKVGRDLWRAAQPFTVALRRREFDRLRKSGHIAEEVPGTGLFLWFGKYDDTRGIAEAAEDPLDLVA